jgi:hypothetical protein
MPTQVTLNQLLFIGFIAGLVCGLVPLILGFKKQNRKFGILGFVLSIIAGIPFSLFGALPIAGVFAWLILRSPSNTKTSETIVNEESVNAPEASPENS